MSIEISPLLREGNLGRILRGAKINPFPGVIGTFMGRDAFSLAASLLGLGANDTVLLPAYLCREVLRPFLGKTRVEFYEVRSDLTIDPEDVRLKLAEARVKMVMIINYFGFLQPYRKEIKKLCANRGTILMEDCAHSLLTEGSGETGDLSIYSFRKTLPLPDGGGLKMNSEEKTVTPNFYPRLYSNILSILSLIRSVSNVRTEILSRAGLSSRGKNLLPKATLAQKSSRFLPLSSFAYNGIGNTSFSENIEKRRRDFQFWQEFVARNNQLTPLFSELPSGVCPLSFPVKVNDRDLLASRFQKEGIYLKIHWRLPTPVGSEFVASHKLSTQMLTLPIYPELGRKEREGIVRLLTSGYRA